MRTIRGTSSEPVMDIPMFSASNELSPAFHSRCTGRYSIRL